MNSPKLSPQKKFAEMEARQREALRQENLALEATRAKTARLRAERLERERRAALAEEKAKAAKPGKVSTRKRPRTSAQTRTRSS